MAVNYPGQVEPLEERPIRELISRLSADGSLLVQQEMALAKKEIGEKVSKVSKDAGAIAVGGAVLYAGVLTLVGAAVLILALVMPLWLSALLVGLAVSAIGAVLTIKGKNEIAKVDLMPNKSVDSVKTDIRMMKEAVR